MCEGPCICKRDLKNLKSLTLYNTNWREGLLVSDELRRTRRMKRMKDGLGRTEGWRRKDEGGWGMMKEGWGWMREDGERDPPFFLRPSTSVLHPHSFFLFVLPSFILISPSSFLLHPSFLPNSSLILDFLSSSFLHHSSSSFILPSSSFSPS